MRCPRTAGRAAVALVQRRTRRLLPVAALRARPLSTYEDYTTTSSSYDETRTAVASNLIEDGLRAAWSGRDLADLTLLSKVQSFMHGCERM